MSQIYVELLKPTASYEVVMIDYNLSNSQWLPGNIEYPAPEEGKGLL